VRTAIQLLLIFAVAVETVLISAVSAQSNAPSIYGTITSGEFKLPGVVITAEEAGTGKFISASTDDQGRYRLALPGPGTYRVRVELFGFSPDTRVLSVIDQRAQADFKLSLMRGEASTPSRPLIRQRPSPDAAAGSTHYHSDEMSLSADLPMDFSFVTGQIAEQIDAPTSPGRGRPLRRAPIHGSAFYQVGNSALNASPYALHGIGATKTEYAQNSFGAAAGGSLPWLKSTSLFASYSGNRSGMPFNRYASVPTAALRGGDFSGFSSESAQPVTIYDPATAQPFSGNRIPLGRMSPAALSLLDYMPLPNGDGVSQNFRSVTSSHTSSDGFVISLAFRPSKPPSSSTQTPVQNNLIAQLGYQRATSNQPNIFPLLGGDSANHAWNASVSYALTKNTFTNDLRFELNRAQSLSSNHFRYDVAADLGINGVSRDRFDWGLPAIGFAKFTGLRDILPSFRKDRSFTISDVVNWSRGKHDLKWGGEFRRLAFTLRRNPDAAGSFVFTGFATAQYAGGVAAPGTGSDFADFLLGLPQKTHVQYSDGAFSFNGNAWNLYFIDDWRPTNNVSVNVGLRYEYVSPFSEAHDRLVTLDAPPDFSGVAVVPAGGVGPFSGQFPNTIVAPDRNNFAPRIGVAWRAAKRLVVRAGYGIDYDTSLYKPLATQLALQPPFAIGQTGIATKGQPLTLTNGFPALQDDAVSNDFAVDRNLPLSYAQIWVLQLQNELPRGFVLVTSYTGTNGTHLQMLRAPNRTATGLLLPNVAPYLWQTNVGSSILHAGSVGVKKRLASGLSFGASYMFSRSIDNVPALGDDTQVAQDDRALERDRGLSAFDQRHRLSVTYAYELPFGRGRRWLNGSAIANRLLGDWSFTGTINYASGSPLTPHATGTSADVETGGYGALRPDLTGEQVPLSQPGVDRFFNTGAFTAPLAGRYGDAGRNIITGPSSFTFDAALAKSFMIADRHNLMFQARAANLLNRPRFTQVDTNLNSLSYGQITGVGPMRMISLGIRYSF
jgi:hypothetical protein